MTMSDPAIEIVAVEKSFGATAALAGVDLRAGAGVTALLGPNGAGKTTLQRVVATVLAADAGAVRILGRDPARGDDRVEIRRRLGYFPQEPGYHPNFTAFEFVDYIAILKEMTDRRARRDEVRRTLEAVHLGDAMHQKIRKLSGGMRRRVILAQALLGDPELLVLDEPTAGLDPELRLRFRELISGIAERQTVLLSTHQTEDVAALAHRVVVMTAGRVRFEGTPSELAGTAGGKVWISDGPDAAAQLSWRTGEGRHRHIGEEAPAGADLVEPTIEDAYLLMAGRQALPVEAA
jgi:ABC-2 type transport system ATP-binding protein